MRKQRQTIEGELGNCLSTCVAMLLYKDVSEVPNFIDPAFYGDRYWKTAMYLWLLKHGQFLTCRKLETPEKVKAFLTVFSGQGPEWWIAVGKGPRGLHHAVVMNRAELYADPHPSDAGLFEITEAYELHNSINLFRELNWI
jgi:hypothetical protein